MTPALSNRLEWWFAATLDEETFKGWADEDFAASLTAVLVEHGEVPAALLDEFHRRSGVDITPPDQPTLDVPGLHRRMEYLASEFRELLAALAADDLVKFADGLGDMIYVLYGTAWRTGIPLPAVLAAIHRSNMTKDATPGDGKAVKGPRYRSPDDDIRAALGLE